MDQIKYEFQAYYEGSIICNVKAMVEFNGYFISCFNIKITWLDGIFCESNLKRHSIKGE